jgi:Carboxypeptidase regulatory-like domain
VFLLGTNLAVQADDDGRFLLNGITSSDGALFARFDADADGTVDRQRTFSLQQLGAGLGVQLSLGDVLLGRSAVVSGRVLREDVSGVSGHAGTSVFVFGAPFVTTTGDDGSFVFEALPEGPARIGALRSGYVPFESGELSLRPGEAVSLAIAELTPSTEVTSTQVRGRVLDATGAGLAGVTVTLTGGAGPVTATSTTTGIFEFTQVGAGRYDARFERTGNQPAALYNVVVFGAGAVVLPDVTLGSGAGQPSLVGEVGGSLDGGSGGTTDAGLTLPDGGVLLPDGGMLSLCPTANGGAPLVFLDAPAVVGYREEVIFSAGRSIDPDCLPLTYHWTALDGGVPPFADNDSLTAAQQRFTAGIVPTVYVVALTVTDDQGLTASTSGQVRVTPRPLVDAGVDFPVSLINRIVTLDASGSVEPLGRALTFTWRVLSGPGQLMATTGALVPLKINATGMVTAEVKVCYLPQHCSLGTVSVQGIATNQITASVLPANTITPLTLGSAVTLTAQATTTTGQDPVTFSWQALDGNLFFTNAGMGPTIDVTASAVGDFHVRLIANAGTASTSIDRTLHVSLPPLVIVDAGVSALSMWMTVSPRPDPQSLNATTLSLTNLADGGTVPFSPRYDGINDRIVALFTTPQVDQQFQFSLSGATIDGGAASPVSLTRTTPQLRFVDSVAHNAIMLNTNDLSAGVAYSPRGPVAFGRYKGGSCATTACLTTFGTRTVEPAETTFFTTALPTDLQRRRAQHVGASIFAWADATTAVVRTDGSPANYATMASQPPGPFFAEGFSAWSIGWPSGSNAAVSTWNGASWSVTTETVLTGPVTTPRAFGDADSTKRYVVVLNNTGKVFLYVSTMNGTFTDFPSPSVAVTTSGAQARVAASPSGPIVAVKDPSAGLTLYRYDGLSWVASVTVPGIQGFDLISREGTVFLAYSSAATLTVASIDPTTLVRANFTSPANTANFASPLATGVGEVELSANDFGDLALAWSESQTGGWRLFLSELR